VEKHIDLVMASAIYSLKLDTLVSVN